MARSHTVRRTRAGALSLLSIAGVQFIGLQTASAQEPPPITPGEVAPSEPSSTEAAPLTEPMMPPGSVDALPPTLAPAPSTTEEQEQAGLEGWGDLSAFEQQAEDSTPVFRAKLYGFIDSYWEKTGKTPESIGDDGKTDYEQNPYEFNVLNLHVMVQGALYDKYRFFVNLASPSSGSPVSDNPVQVRNAWVEAPLWGRFLNVRVGKTYRRFGLYNEILDAVPTFIGIEPPEIFDKDHLMLTRTTNLMLHGSTDAGSGVFNYSLTTGNDERSSGSFPIGGDVNIELPFGLKAGSSFYFSGGAAEPSRSVGDGSPTGGVENWMRKDTYRVLGGYLQLRNGSWILQAEYWRGHHDARRDADAVATMLADGRLFPTQVTRFATNGDPAMIRTRSVYDIDAFYFRGGYEIPLGKLTAITPYLQFDYYSNPETVKPKSLGGDNEAGAAEDGKFAKYTAGGVFRPVPQVALKVDSSVHSYKFNKEHVFYPEIRASFSYLWELAQ